MNLRDVLAWLGGTHFGLGRTVCGLIRCWALGKMIERLPAPARMLALVVLPLGYTPAQAGDQPGPPAPRMIDICHLVQNPPIPPLTAVNVFSPIEAAWDSLSEQDRQGIGTVDTAARGARMTIAHAPQYGKLILEEGPSYRYQPNRDYFGRDQATVLVELGSKTITLVYHFKIDTSSWGGTEGYDPYWDEKHCPSGPLRSIN